MEHRQGVHHKKYKNQIDPNLAKVMEEEAGDFNKHENTHNSRQNSSTQTSQDKSARHRVRDQGPAVALAFPSLSPFSLLGVLSSLLSVFIV